MGSKALAHAMNKNKFSIFWFHIFWKVLNSPNLYFKSKTKNLVFMSHNIRL